MIDLKKHSKSDNAERSVKKEYSIRGLAGKSLIIFLIDKLSEIVHKTLINGFFGFIFSAYSDELCAYENGYFLDYFKGNKRNSSFFRKIREYLSRNFETSFILKKLKQKYAVLLSFLLKRMEVFFLLLEYIRSSSIL